MIHVLMCVVAYPLLTITTVVATKGKTLFWTRFVVGLGCGIVGFALGLSLLALGKAFLEAASKWLSVASVVVFLILILFPFRVASAKSLGDGSSSVPR